MKRTIVWVLVWSLALLAGCTRAAPEPGAEVKPREKELVVGHHLDPVTLNPCQTTTAAFQSVYAQIVEQLVVFAPDGREVLPWLAREWKWIDNLTLEMKLREGVMFTNGEPIDAEAARFSIECFVESSWYQWLLPQGVYRETEIVDSHTIRVHLNEPFAPFLGFLARGGAVMPPKYYQEVGGESYGQAPVGTGPFMLQEWVKDSHIVLERNPDYWGGLHPISRVTYRVIPEETVRIAALETGEIHIALMLPVSALDRLHGSDKVSVVTFPGLRKFATHLDTTSGPSPLDDARVRIALNLAVDKQAIVDSVFHGAADALEGQWLTRGEFGFNPNISMFPYDPAEAKRLLAEAGFPNGFNLEFAYTVGRYAQDKEMGEAVASYLEKVGIRVKQRPLEYGTFLSLQKEHKVGTHQWGLLLPPEPHFNFRIFMDPLYEFHPLGEEYAVLVIEAARETDQRRREELYHRLGQIMNEDPPMLFLLVPRDIYGVSKVVKGFTPRTDQVLWLFSVDLQ